MSSIEDGELPGASRRLAEMTTLRLGGPASHVVEAYDESELVEAVKAADASGDPLLLLAGGSNVVVSDVGWPGTVVRVLTSGIERTDLGEVTRLRVQAGEPWDPFVAFCVEENLSGVESLSGIPGSVGATPIQNVGAYGQEVAETITSVTVLDRDTGAVVEFAAEDCGFGYRTSRFRGSPRWVITAVTLELERSPESRGVRYGELARALGIEVGDVAPLRDVREAVLALRRGKGMVIDPADPDSVSAGSFFTNPILDQAAFAELQRRVREALGADAQVPVYPEADGRVKTSAAWLIERAGFRRGHGDGPAGISSKHTLALVNRGNATTHDLVSVAREIADGVHSRFGVELRPEPIFIGHEWSPRPPL